MLALKGYALQEMVLQKGHHSFYRAVKETDGVEVFIKILERSDPGTPESANLRREFEICSKLNHNGFLKAHEFIEFHGGAALVLESYNGTELRQHISLSPLSLRDFLMVSINLVDAVRYMHTNEVIHKDLKPSNILIHTESLGIKVIDFGIASLIPQEDIEQANHKILEGSLNYISPEQTGRMNRSLDFRSDLYSLGATLYEMVSGKRPFESEDPMELVHAHLAVKPLPLTTLLPDLPQTVSDIVLKLLEKPPENRYKSCYGLKHDLVKCLHFLEKDGHIPRFEIAKEDFSEKLSISQLIYGREEEIKAMLSAYTKTLSGNAQVLFVSGMPGIGKSVLANEMRKSIVENRGLYIRGKFDQFNRNIPYSAIIDAFQELFIYTLSVSPDELNRWKTLILNEIGEFGQLIIDVLPALALVIGKQPSVSELPSVEASNRFSIVFQNFVRALSSGLSSLVLFLDDLQWADSASIQLLEFLLADESPKKLMIIGAYRDNEIQAGSALQTFIVDAENRNNAHKIHLGPFKSADLISLVADTFHTHVSEVEQLCALIDVKTKRNPFFVSEFIKSLYKKGLVYFDQNLNVWCWSIGKIEQSNITDNVVELVTETLHSLAPETQNLCALAASIGNQFNLQTLAHVNEKNIENTSGELWQAIKEGIIIPQSEEYRAVSNNLNNAHRITYKFLHDRVQQAAYNMIPEHQKAAIHLKIGRLFKASENNGNSENRLFEMVNHLNKGLGLINSFDERLELSKLNKSAGTKAKKSSAFGPAFGHFINAISLLPANHWETDYALSLDLYNEAAEMAYLSVKSEEVTYYTDEIFTHTKGTLDALNAYLVKIAFFASKGNHAKAVEVGYEILNKLEVKLPVKPSKLNVLGGLISIKIILKGKSSDDIFSLSEMESSSWKAAMFVLSTITGSAYITNTNLFVLIVFKMISLSVKHGKNRFSSFGFAVLGMVLAGMSDLQGVKKYAQLSRRLLEFYPEDEQYSKVNYCLLTLHFLHHPYRNSQRLMLQNVQKAFDSGDLLYGSYSVFYHACLKFYGGFHLKTTISEIEPLSQKLNGLNQKVGYGWTQSVLQTMYNLSNRDKTETKVDGHYFGRDEMLPSMHETNNVSGITLMYVMEGTMAYILGDLHTARNAFRETAKSLDSMLGTPMVSAYYFYNALTLTKDYEMQGAFRRMKSRMFLNKSISMYEKWNEHCNANNYSRLNILKGIKASLNRRHSEVVTHFHEAIAHSEEQELTQETALAHELLALRYAENNQHQLFVTHIAQARFYYHQWGSMAKARLLEDQYHLQIQENKTNETDPEHTTYSTDTLDLQTIIKSSQALSSEVQLEGLFNSMIHIVMENAGATCCVVVLKENDKWMQRASNRIENGNRRLRLDIIELSDAHISSLDLPLSIGNYVIRTRISLSLDHPQHNPAYANDPYLTKHHPQSVLCLPFGSKGEDLGILYLENDLIANAFTKERIRLLTIVTSQLAISIDNALLYESLEQKVQVRTADLMVKNKELEAEKIKSDQLLLNILPEEIAKELKEFKTAKARSHKHATVLFADVKGFTSIAANLSPEDLVTMLHNYFCLFDDISTKYGLEKIKTIGDAYMAVGGVPEGNQANPVKVVQAAKEMILLCEEIAAQNEQEFGNFFEFRIGIHTGPVVSGIVGTSKFQFDIWGDTVNVASRLEQLSEPGKINISRTTYEDVKNEFTCVPRGLMPVKNRDTIEMFYVC